VKFVEGMNYCDRYEVKEDVIGQQKTNFWPVCRQGCLLLDLKFQPYWRSISGMTLVQKVRVNHSGGELGIWTATWFALGMRWSCSSELKSVSL
jgi:hypothetical protein